MRTIDEIKADIETWNNGPSRNKYIVKELEAELESVQKAEPSTWDEVEIPERKTYTEKELFKLNKKEQVEILEKLGADEIPRYEKARVQMILDLQ